jgi:hypothetical protein
MPPDSSVTMADASESSKSGSLSEQHAEQEAPAAAAASAATAGTHNEALIKELEERLRCQRRNLRMHKHPIKTLR